MKPIRLFDQDPATLTETPKRDYLPDLEPQDPKFMNLRDGGNMPSDAGLVTPFALIAIGFGLATLIAVWVLT